MAITAAIELDVSHLWPSFSTLSGHNSGWVGRQKKIREDINDRPGIIENEKQSGILGKPLGEIMGIKVGRTVGVWSCVCSGATNRILRRERWLVVSGGDLGRNGHDPG